MNKKISINDSPKYIRFLIYILIYIPVIFVRTDMNPDTYFLIDYGKYITTNGFPTIDPFTMHSNLSLVVQQWLSDIIYYFSYKVLGFVGPVVIAIAIYIIFITLFYKLCKLVSNNLIISVFITFFYGLIISIAFFSSRPQIFTYTLFLCELLAIESYRKTKNAKYLIALPFISLIQINMHASMWLFIFIILLPYLVDSLNIKIGKFHTDGNFKTLPLIISAIIMFAVGFINPYGFKAMTYVLTSYGYSSISESINEMLPPNINSFEGKVYIAAILSVPIIYAIYRKGKARISDILFALGFGYMAFSSIRSVPLFLFGATFGLAFYLKDIDIKLTIEKKETDKKKRKALISVLIALILVAALVLVDPFNFLSPSSNQNSSESVSNENTKDDDGQNVLAAIKYLDTLNKDDIVLYNAFNEGAYLEFYGYKTYIDPRAEIFLKDNNHQYDYLDEFLDLQSGDIYYKDFIDRYDFNTFFLSNKDILSVYLVHDSNYKIVYSNNDYTIMVRNAN